MSTTPTPETVRCPTCGQQIEVHPETRKVAMHRGGPRIKGFCASSLLSVSIVTGGRVK